MIKSKLFLNALIIGLLTFITPLSLIANDKTTGTAIKGVIKNQGGQVIEAASVSIKELQRGTLSNEKGKFHISAKPGTYTVYVQYLGYKTYEKRINLKEDNHISLNITLEDENIKLDEVVIESKSPVKRVKESALNVVAIDTKALYNTSLDISKTLEKVSGIKIREIGGVGSDTQIALNGFSGKHIRVFMDGVPMEASSSSFQINNIPINLAERIEVYKGVVPVEFGGDALGGAINIVTKKSSNTFVDASYSYGSFNTHKSNLSVGYTAKNGFNVNLNAYQNYSDNDYKVKTRYLDLSTGTYSDEERWYKRFHDRYHNEALIAKIGFVNTKWADSFLFGINLSQESADIQNANLMHIVFGKKKRKAEGINPSFTYAKRNLFVPNLHVNVNANYNNIKNQNIDTVARQYNWAGEYREKAGKGEGQYTDSKTTNENYSFTANVNYSLINKHFFTFNNVFTNYQRKTDANKADGSVSESSFMRRVNKKNTLGFSYKFNPIKQWNILGFVKHYSTTVQGPMNVSSTTVEKFEEKKKSSSTTGYGFATTYHISPALQVKASYEQAYRLPSERELFGDDLLESGNASIKPENSKNLNLNVSFDYTFNDIHNLALDGGFIYRKTTDYIRRIITMNGIGSSVNHGDVNTVGVDFEGRYTFKNAFNIGGNITYQNIRNMERYSPTGQELIYYKDRLPNAPYLFGSLDMSYNFNDLIVKKDFLSIGYNLRYVHSFYRDWKSEGGDLTIPKQLSHDLSLTYSLKNGRYNIAFEANNITDEILYDNYSLQKPGRNFSGKIRYYFYRNK